MLPRVPFRKFFDTDDPRLLRGNKNWIKSIQSGERTREKEKKKGKKVIYPSIFGSITISFPGLVLERNSP